MGSFLTASGSRLFFQDLPGERTPIVFIHGLGCASSSDYPEVAASPALHGHRKILVDLPGFGLSAPNSDGDFSLKSHGVALAQLLLHLGLKDLHLFGHSMGGAFAISLAQQIPETMRSLVLSEGNLDPGGGPTSRRIASFTQEDYLAFGHQSLVEENKAGGNCHWAQSLERCHPKAIHQGATDLVQGVDPSWRTLFQSFRFPRTYIFGERNEDAQEAQALRDHGVAVTVVPGAGHNMALENPEGLAERIQEAIGLSTKP